jgi:hypothetical protein
MGGSCGLIVKSDLDKAVCVSTPYRSLRGTYVQRASECYEHACSGYAAKGRTHKCTAAYPGTHTGTFYRTNAPTDVANTGPDASGDNA